MGRRAVILAVLVSWLMLLAGCTVAKKPLDPLMGEFEGTFTPHGGQAIKAEAKVIANGNNTYWVVIRYPAADAKATRLELTGQGKDGEVAIASTDWLDKPVAGNWTGKVTKDSLSIVSDDAKGGKAEMKRVERKSPTLGQKPPADAVVLLPFEEGKVTNLNQWDNQRWICEPDGSILVGGGDNKTNQKFGSFKLHLEFYVPFMPAKPGSTRGNSGVFLHNRYEVEVVDSFGLKPGDRTCGAISGLKAPDINASLPPGRWQTYDIEFKAPRFDKTSGEQTRGALITVLLNGVKIQNAPEVVTGTSGDLGYPDKTGPIRLQDNADPVQFRNIWLVEEKEK